MKTTLAASRKFLIPLIVLALLVFLGLSLKHKNQAPDVTFTPVQGKQIKMSELQGKMVLVNFWATDCPGCIAEMPELIETYKQYRDRGFEVMAVAMFYDPPSHVLNYTTKNNLPFPVMHDGYGEVAERFNDVSLTPTAFVVDQQGRIVINSTLRDYAGLGSEVVIKGLIRRAEIWDKATWLAKAERGDTAVNKKVRQLGVTGRRNPRTTDTAAAVPR